MKIGRYQSLRERPDMVSLIIYITVAVLSVIVILMGAAYSYTLRDKIFIFGPAFLIIIIVAFYGLVLEPKPFYPTRVQRYAVRPPAVDELSRLLRISSLSLAGERMYKIMKGVILRKLDLKPDADNDKIEEIARIKYPHLADQIILVLSRYKDFVKGDKKIASEKEFLDHYFVLIRLIYSFDGKI